MMKCTLQKPGAFFVFSRNVGSRNISLNKKARFFLKTGQTKEYKLNDV